MTPFLGRLAVAAAVAFLLPVTVATTPAAATTPPGTVSGIDISTWQAGIDFTDVRADGHQFVIVKAGGSQLSDGPYIGSQYATQVNGARAAGLRVGHYWLAGDFQTPAQAADYFAAHLHDYRSGDVIALDNEVLDDSTRLWNDAEATAFFQRMRERIGDHVPWLYMGAADLRSGTWPRTIAAGVKLWVASWGANNGNYPGEPNLGGAYPTWGAHQYTSSGSTGGIARVDLNVAKPGAFEIVSGGPTEPPVDDPLPKTSTEQDGIPGSIFYKRMQNWLRITSGYTGPIDGVPGVNTYAALQRAMRGHGYTGPIDGAPGTNTWKAVQRLASGWGYTGPIDGVMGPNSWRGFARFLNQDQWD
ncbi:glycoside hydrolase family 25 protein [Micromonospora peucetia]|uniref:glycoside hydrolase family 25 protein n=1 Tax=Micromonospora peucetia TaxID=47871 RepID=UPI00332792B4